MIGVVAAFSCREMVATDNKLVWQFGHKLQVESLEPLFLPFGIAWDVEERGISTG